MIIKAKANFDFEKNVLVINEEFQPHTEQEHEYLKVVLAGELEQRSDDLLIVNRTLPIPSDAQDKVKLAMINKERAAKNQPPLDELPEDTKAKAVAVGGGDDEEETHSRKHYAKRH
jgi:hypothetical protein